MKRVCEQRTIDLQIPLLLLYVLRNVDFVHVVLQAQFFEGTRDLLAVGGSGCVAVKAMSEKCPACDFLMGTNRSISTLGDMMRASLLHTGSCLCQLLRFQRDR